MSQGISEAKTEIKGTGGKEERRNRSNYKYWVSKGT
jgi:hypothetical protein